MAAGPLEPKKDAQVMTQPARSPRSGSSQPAGYSARATPTSTNRLVNRSAAASASTELRRVAARLLAARVLGVFDSIGFLPCPCCGERRPMTHGRDACRDVFQTVEVERGAMRGRKASAVRHARCGGKTSEALPLPAEPAGEEHDDRSDEEEVDHAPDGEKGRAYGPYGEQRRQGPTLAHDDHVLSSGRTTGSARGRTSMRTGVRPAISPSRWTVAGGSTSTRTRRPRRWTTRSVAVGAPLTTAAAVTMCSARFDARCATTSRMPSTGETPRANSQPRRITEATFMT